MLEALWRVVLEVISETLVKLFSRQDTVSADPRPSLDRFTPVDSRELLDLYDGLPDQN